MVMNMATFGCHIKNFNNFFKLNLHSKLTIRNTDSSKVKHQVKSQIVNVPPLGPPVLEPGLDLGVGHLELLGQGGPLCRGQVLLSVEALLQLHDLGARERRPGLLALGRRAVLVGMANTSNN